MSDTVIVVRPETADRFGLTEVDGKVDLARLASEASRALKESDEALARAREITDGNWIAQWFQSGEMHRQVIGAIGHIRTIAQVNVALSAICNDLAARNLEDARVLGRNQDRTAQRLNELHRAVDDVLGLLAKSSDPPTTPDLGRTGRESCAGDCAGSASDVRLFRRQFEEQHRKLLKIGEKVEADAEEFRGFAAEIRSDVTELRDRTRATQEGVARRVDACEQLIASDIRRRKTEIESVQALLDKLEARLSKVGGDVAQTDAFARISVSRIGRRLDDADAARDSMKASIDANSKQLKMAVGSELRRMMKASRVDLLTACGMLLALQLIGIGFAAHWAGLW